MPGSGLDEPDEAESSTRPISIPAPASASGSEQSQFETTATATPAPVEAGEQRGDVGEGPKCDRIAQQHRRLGGIGVDAELCEDDRGTARPQRGERGRVGSLVAVVDVVVHLGEERALGGGRRDPDAQVPPQRPAQAPVRVVDVDQRPERIQQHRVVAAHGIRSEGCSRWARSRTSATTRGPVSLRAAPSIRAKWRSRTAGRLRVALLVRSPASVTPRPAKAR